MNRNRWLLPEGIGEILADDARALEKLRRELLDLLDAWGYDLIFPPLIEYTDSLLTGLGENLDSQTFKLSAQQNDRHLGIRADISPQAARIDAHSMKADGANRLCYAGTVVRARPDPTQGNSAPVQLGAELFGVDGLDADVEIIDLMLEVLGRVTDQPLTLKLSHQTVHNWLAQVAGQAGLSQDELSLLIGAKRLPELSQLLMGAGVDPQLADRIRRLPRLMGGIDVLDEARQVFVGDSAMLEAVDELALLADRLGHCSSRIRLFFNIGETRFSDYHTGVLFSVYAGIDDVATLVANGGRYNQVGEAFGRSRPATGFSTDLKTLVRLLEKEDSQIESIYAPLPSNEASMISFNARVKELRQQGFRVKIGYPDAGDYLAEYRCQQQLIESDGVWVLTAMSYEQDYRHRS